VGITLPMTALFNYATVDALAKYLLDEVLFGIINHPSLRVETNRLKLPSGFSRTIAIIGVGCRFPGGVYDWILSGNCSAKEKCDRRSSAAAMDINAYYHPVAEHRKNVRPSRWLYRSGRGI